jgi:hypothetical protein
MVPRELKSSGDETKLGIIRACITVETLGGSEFYACSKSSETSDEKIINEKD